MPPDQKNMVELVQVLDGTVKDLEEYLKESNIDTEDIEKIIELEKAHKNRITAKRLLKRYEKDKEIEKEITDFKSDLEDLKNNLTQLKEVDTSDRSEDIETSDIVEVLDGRISDLKGFLNRKEPSIELLEQMIELESSLKNRQRAKEVLNNKITELKIAKDFQKTESDVENLIRDIEKSNMEQLVEEGGNGDKEDNRESFEDAIVQEERKESLKKSSTDSSEAQETTNEEKTEDQKEGDDNTDQEDDDHSEEEENTEKPEEDNEEESEGESSNNKEDEDEKTELEEKKELLSEMSVEMKDEEIRKLDIEEIKEMKKEKEEREELIKNLKSSHDEEELRKASTSDLKKLKEENKEGKYKKEREELIDDLSPYLKEERDELEKLSLEELEELEEEKEERQGLIDDLSDTLDRDKLKNASTEDLRELKNEKENMGKDRKEMEEEAEEDLEMLKGARADSKSEKNEENEETNSKKYTGKLAGLKYFRDDIKAKIGISSESPTDETGFSKKKVLNLISEYEDLEGQEKIIKTAHIVKGYVEFKENIEKEMTYLELADKLKEKDEKYSELADYLEKIGKQEYTGKLEEMDAEKMFEVSKNAINKA